MVTNNKISELFTYFQDGKEIHPKKTIEDYFEYIVESKINGNYSQVRELIKGLTKDQRIEFVDWLSNNEVVDKEYLTKLLVE